MLPECAIDDFALVFFVRPHSHHVEDTRRDNRECPVDLNALDLNGNQRDRPVEEAYHVQEPARDVLRHNDGDMVVLRVSAFLDVPVLDGADDV